VNCSSCGNTSCFEPLDDNTYVCCECGAVIEPELTIPLGETWSGFEFIKIRKYKRKQGYKITFIRRYWSGKYRTLATEQAQTADEIIQKIKENLLPIFEIPEKVKEEIRRFCGEREVIAACRI